MKRLKNLQLLSVIIAVAIFAVVLRALFINLNAYAAERGVGDSSRYILLTAGTTLALVWLIVQVAASLTIIRRLGNSESSRPALRAERSD